MITSAVLCGLGAWVPPNVITNNDLAARLDTTTEWIQSRTGIVRRHVAGPDAGTADLAVEAGWRALLSANRDFVDYVVLATTTPDRLCPATAPEVATRLGLGDVPAYDVAAVCSGFLYGLQTGRALISAEIAETVLVVAAESFRTLVDPDDRVTSPIFGDGAGAVVLRAGEATDPGALHALNLHSDGSLAELITVDGGGARARARHDTSPAFLRMQGKLTFAHAIKHMEAVTRRTLADSGWTVAEVDHVVGHQANARILRSLAKHLGLTESQAVIHIDDVGNTAAASIPLALHHGAVTNQIRTGDKLVLPAFGAGATWGAATLTWPELTLT